MAQRRRSFLRLYLKTLFSRSSNMHSHKDPGNKFFPKFVLGSSGSAKKKGGILSGDINYITPDFPFCLSPEPSFSNDLILDVW